VPPAERHDPAGAPPARVRGPRGPWDRPLSALAADGHALLYGYVSDWVPDGADDRGDDGADGGGPSRLLASEAPRYRAYRSPGPRRRFAASRLLLKHAAGVVLGTDPARLELGREPNGRPYLRGCRHLEISLSHSGDLVAVGLSLLGPVGVDVEASARRVYGSGLEEEALTGHERAALGRLPEEERNAAVIRLWTLKEAYGKARGLGLRLPPRSFGFPVPGDPGAPAAGTRLLRADGTPADDRGWRFETHRLEGRWTLSAAVAPAPFGAVRDPAAGALLDRTLAAAVVPRRPARHPEPGR